MTKSKHARFSTTPFRAAARRSVTAKTATAKTAVAKTAIAKTATTKTAGSAGVLRGAAQRTTLGRRRFLQGAVGTTILLPWLEALGDGPSKTARAAEAGEVGRKIFVGLYHPNGVFTPEWFPTKGASDNDFTLGPIHAQALEPLRQDLLFTSGIDMPVAFAGTGEMHQRGIGGWLTNQKLASGQFVGNNSQKAGYAKGPSIDQIIARKFSQGTLRGSLELGVHSLTNNVLGAVSYSDSEQVRLPELDPKVVFQWIFGGRGGPGCQPCGLPLGT